MIVSTESNCVIYNTLHMEGHMLSDLGIDEAKSLLARKSLAEFLRQPRDDDILAT